MTGLRHGRGAEGRAQALRWAWRLPALLPVLFALPLLTAPPAMAGLADECNAAGEPQRQINGCSTLIETGALSPPQLAAAHINRANALLRTGRFELALADLDRALALQPGNPRALNSRGVAKTETGDLTGAIADFDAAIAIAPRFAGAYNNRGDAWQAKGEPETALADWETAIEIDGAQRVERWQTYLERRGLYDGPKLGRYTPETRAAIAACARDPAC